VLKIAKKFAKNGRNSREWENLLFMPANRVYFKRLMLKLPSFIGGKMVALL
jgi:hypothetical protein